MRLLRCLALAGLVAACEPHSMSSTAELNTSNTQIPAVTNHQTKPLPHAFVKEAATHISHFHQLSVKFQQAVRQFLSSHSEDNWQNLKALWLKVHQSWHLCDFYFTTIRDQGEQYAELNTLLSHIHSVPLSPGYLDSIDGYPFSGLVNDTTVAIAQQVIVEQHQRYDSTEVAIGLHALEFFLWARSREDYLAKKADTSTNAGLQASHRRGQYLAVLADILAQSSKQLIEQWQMLAQQAQGYERPIGSQLLIRSVAEQLQALKPHSQFKNQRDVTSAYHWQGEAITQLEHWLSNQIRENTSLLAALETLKQQIFDGNQDLTTLNEQVSVISKQIHLLEH